MVSVILLALIYLSFISLGLPDSILGAAIPALQNEWGIPLSAGGVVSFVIIASTTASAFLSIRLVKIFGTGKIVFLSCLMTGCALLGFSLSSSFMYLPFLAIPLGFGGGGVDTALNNYVAHTYKARHMNWLHSFWGLGATMGPLIMAQALESADNWRMGYRMIAFIQLILANVLLLTLPLWKKQNQPAAEELPETPQLKGGTRIPGVAYAVITMLLYCAVEQGAGLWGSSFLVKARGLPVEAAAGWIAMYYGGIMIGRFLAGFISSKLTNVQMIRYGIGMAFTAILLLFIPLPPALIGTVFVLIGLGLSPVFPAMIHETPARFGKSNSQKIIGVQMGFAYIGSAAFPPVLGLLFQFSGMSYFPGALVVLTAGLFLASQKIDSAAKAA